MNSKRLGAVVHVLKKVISRHSQMVKDAVTCGSVLSLGDCLAQKMEQKFLAAGERTRYDYERTGSMFIIGVTLGPLQHHFYKNLDKFYPGNGIKVVMKKISADQFIQSPLYYAGFIIGGGLLERESLHECVEELKDKFVTIYMADLCVWPAAQFVNFYYLPPRFRVLYVSSLSLFWSIFLSCVKHMDTQNYHYQPHHHYGANYMTAFMDDIF